MNLSENEFEIDLLALIRHLWKKVWQILLVTAIFTLAGLLVSMVFITPQYTASTRMYVLSRSNANTVVSADFQISNYMISDYQELIKGRNVTGEVIARLGLDMTDMQLAEKITVSAPNNTRVLHIDVEDSDPVRAQQIANTVREVTSEQLLEIVQVDSVKTVYEAITPKEPSSPNVIKNAIIAGLLGFGLIAGILSVIFIMDDRIRNEDDLERYLGISMMGVIPDREKLREPIKSSKKKSGKIQPRAKR